MANISRRDVVRQLGLISTLGSLQSRSFAEVLAAGTKSQQSSINQDFYVIFSGTWLFSIDKTQDLISATAIAFPGHSYKYAVTSEPLPPDLPDVEADKGYAVQVKGKNPYPKYQRKLVQQMIDSGQGTFFNDQVESKPSAVSGRRTVQLSMPSSIVPAALLSRTDTLPLVSCDPANTLQPTVSVIPGAIAFVYSNWASASFGRDGTSIKDFKEGSGVHLMFRVCPTNTCDKPLGCNDSETIADQEKHTTDMFGDLTKLLTIKKGNDPTISFPTPDEDDPKLTISRGGDPTLSLYEIGMFDTSCALMAKRGYPIGKLHTCAAAGIFVGA